MRKLKLFFACLLMAFLGIGQVWAAEQVAYTLTPAAGSNNSYTGNCDVAISGITWNVTGNASLTPWRIGGKSLSSVNRTVFSKTAMSDAITKVELKVGAASSITVNSLKLIVASNSDFSTQIDEVSQTFTANSTITFTPTSPTTEWTTGAYYKFVFNVSVSGTSNKFVEFSEAKFYKEQETPAYTIAATSSNTNHGTVSLSGNIITGSPETGCRYANPAYSVSPANSATVSQNGNEFTVTPSANTTVTINFEAIPPHTISFSTNGCGSIDNMYVLEGAEYDVTSATPTIPAGCQYNTFVGWTLANSIANESQLPELITTGTMGNANMALKAVYSKTTGGGGASGNTTIDTDGSGVTGSYADGTNKGEYKWSFTQLIKGSSCMQGNSSKSSILWNTKEFPAAITKVELVVGNAAGANSTAGLCFGSSVKPTTDVNVALGSGTSYALNATGTLTITEGIPANSTFMSVKWTNGASYYSSVKVYWGSEGVTTYSLDPTCTAASAPEITTEPMGANYYEGDEATALTVAATTSGGDLHYQWKSNATNSVEGASNVGTDAASYTPSTGTAGTTYYFCVVSDENGSATSAIVPVVVTAKVDPEITFNDGSVENGYTLDLSTLFASNSEGAVTYSVIAGDAATIDGTILTGSSVGSVTVQASQATYQGYNAKTATCTITVTKALPRSSLIFAQKFATGGATANDGAVWEVTSDGTESDFEGTGSSRGIHYGTNSAEVQYIRLATDDILGTIKKVVVNASAASGVSATASVTVGGEAFGGDAKSLTTSAAEYTFEGSASGEIVVLITKEEKATKALYCKSIIVIYEPIPTYSVNFAAPEHGTMAIYSEDNLENAISTGAEFEANKELMVVLEPGDGFKGGTVSVVKTESPTVDVTEEVYANGIITMPDYAITVSATFAAKAVSAVTVTNPEHGTITVTEGEKAIGENVMEGKVLSISVSGTGYTFTPKAYKTGETSTVVAITNGKLTMPAYAITITADEAALPCASLDAPTLNGEVDVTYKQATIAWNTVANADGYVLNITKGTTAVLTDELIEAPTVSYVKTGLAANTQYHYTVMAIGDGNEYCDESNDLLEGDFTTSGYPYAHVTYSVNGVTNNAYTTAEPEDGRQIETPFALPTNVSSGCTKVFVGWTTETYKNYSDDTEPAELYTANFTIHGEEDVTLYAVFATETPTVIWTETAISELTASDVVVIVGNNGDTYAMANDNGTSSAPAAKAVTVSGTQLTGEIAANLQWNISKDESNYTIYPNGSITSWLYCTEANNGVRVGTNDSKTFVIDQGYLKHVGTSRYVGIYNSQDWRCYTGITGQSNIAGQTFKYYKRGTSDPVYSDYATTCQGQAETPEFTGAENNKTYTTTKSISITAEEGAIIYYTINGDDPTTTDDEFNSESPISLSSNGTYVIKAVAYAEGKNPSEFATLTVTIDLPLTTMDEIFAKATTVGTTATNVHITFDNWVVSGINGNNAYITDGTKGFVIFASNHGFEVNDKINGTVACKLELYRGFAEVTTLTASNENLTITKDGVVTPIEVNIADLGGAYTGAPIILKNVSFNGTTLNDASSNSITPYTTFYAKAVTDLEENKVYNITGIYIQFNNTKEIAPRSAADIVLQVKESPTMAWYVDNTKEVAITTSYKVTVGATDFTLYFETNSDGTVTYNSLDENVATINATTGAIHIVATGSSSTTITANVAADETHIASSKSFTLIVREAGPDFEHGDWTLVKDAAELTAGSYVIIAASDANVAMKSYVEGNNCRSEEATILSGDMLEYDEDFGIFEIADYATSYKTFQDVNTNQYLCLPDNSNKLTAQDAVDDMAGWTITSVSNAGEAVITSKSQTGRTIRYNDNSDLFACYTSGQKDIALYKYYAPVPKVTYVANAGEDDVTGLPAVQKTVWNESESAYKATLADGLSRHAYEFTGWNTVADGSGTAYDAGTAYAFAVDVTLYAQWNQLSTHSVSYSANGGIGDAPAAPVQVYPSETVTILANTFNNPGFVYAGWQVVYNDGENNHIITPDENNQFSMPAYDVVIKALWEEPSNQKWVRVETTDDLKTDGTKYIIVGAENDVAMTTLNDGFYNCAAVVKTGNALSGPESMTQVTLKVGSESGKFAIKNGSKYIYSTAVKSVGERDESFEWTISISNGVATITASGVGDLKYNNQNPRFNTYASGQKPVAIYREKAMKVIDNDDMTEDDVNTNDDVEIAENKTWTVSNNKTVGDVYLKEGAIIDNSAVVTANDLYFKAKYGKSNQVIDASKLAVNGDFYYDYQLCEGTLDADYWYSIAVPFDVNLSDGVSLADGTPLTNGTHFEVWEYDTQKRAQTMSNGWKRNTSGKMEAGKAYLIGFNPGMPNTIRLKAAQGWQENLFSGNLITLESSTTGTQGDHDNWNGIANPKMRYTSVDQNVGIQVFNNNTHTFSGFDYSNTTFVVGLAFFVQSTGSLAIGNVDYGEGHYRAPQRASQDYAYSVQIKRPDATYFDNQIVVRASEDATNAYEQGHDMLTMNNATSNTAALLWTENYGGKRLAIEEAPLVNNQAMYDLRIYAPADGTYSLSAAAKEGADLYVTYEGAIVWNLSLGDYELDLTRGTTTGYGLLLVVQPNQMPTGVENGELLNGENGVQKILLNGQLYILRDGHLYDAVGKEMK